MRGLIALSLVAFLTTTSTAGPCPEDRECVGLVLAGGGARGAAHIGVIEVMEDLQVPVDFIVGTSMGAVIGGMYASGMSPAEMREEIDAIDWEATFNDDPPRRNIPFRQKQDDDRSLFKFEFGVGQDGFNSPLGLVAGQKLNFLLASLLLHTTDTTDFDDLAIPFRAIAVDLNSGELVVQGSGVLPTAIRASMAYPVFFTPVKSGDMLLVDGGVLRNLPVDVAIEMGADRMIAIDVGSPFKDLDRAGSAFKVASRTLSVMTAEGRRDQRELIRDQDLLIVPDLEGVTAFKNFDSVGIAVERGVDAGRANEEGLKAFSVDDDTFAEYIQRHRAGRRMADTTIDKVVVTGLKRVSEKRVVRRLETKPGSAIDIDTLSRDLQEVYRIGEFEDVGFNLRHEGDETALEIVAAEKSWGPWFYRLGASAAANFNGSGDFTANLLVRRPNLNPLGAEWKIFATIGSVDQIDTDFYQPLEYTGSFFVAPRFYSGEKGDEKYEIGTLNVGGESNRHETGLDLGAKLFSIGELRVGALIGKAKITAQDGEFEKIDDTLGGWRVRFVFDGLDNANFPRSGTFSQLEYYLSVESMGADREYSRLFASLGHAWKIGRWTQIAGIEGGTDLGSDLPLYDTFRLGGFLNVSGLTYGELTGSKMGQIRLITYRKIGRLQGLFGGNLYLGGSLEAGATWQDEIEEGASLDDAVFAGSLWGGMDSMFGPLYLGWGLAEGGRSQWYLLLGRMFGSERPKASPRLGG